MTDKKLRLATGTSDFKELITTSDVYVDQTLFVKEFLDTLDKATLITRPRRWGKSLILDITRRFFGLEVDGNGEEVQINSNRALFAGGTVKIVSSITGNEEDVLVPISKLAQVDSGYYLQGQGKDPVIYIDFQEVKATNYQDIEKLFRKVIVRKFSEYAYLSRSTILSTKEKEDFAKCAAGNMPIEDLKDSLRFLTQLLHTHHGRPVIVLIDEYDKVVNNLLYKTFNDKDLQDEVADLLTSILTPCGKGNKHLKKMLMVGIFDTVKETESGFSNLQVYGISQYKYGEYFGFTEEEVGALVALFPTGNAYNKTMLAIKDWYNGYNIPTFEGEEPIKVYNPWSVMLYLEACYNTETGLFKPQQPMSYWVTSGAKDILERLLNAESCANSTISKKFVELTQNSNSSVSLNFDSSSSLMKYDLNHATQRANIFSYLLLNSGYLTIDREGARRFRLPNAEVKDEFIRVVEAAIKDVMDNKPSFCRKILDNLNRPKHIKAIKAITSGDSVVLADLFSTSGSLRCEDQDLNFNYFHIAAIYGNEKTFNVLRNNCDAKLLQSTDAYNLKPIDYAHMLNRSIPRTFRTSL